MSATAVILAAGAGSRLGEIGRRHSKAMLPVAGRPLIAWVVDRLKHAGVDDLVVVGHTSDAELALWLARAHPRAALVQQHERRGIADALRLALPSLDQGEAHLACACDSVFASDDIAAMLSLGRCHRDAAVIGVLDMGIDATASRSAVQVERDRVVAIVEKPAPGTVRTPLVSMPLYWLPPSFAPYLDDLPSSGEAYVSTALAAFIAGGGTLLALPVRGRVEVTTPADIAAAERALR